MFRDWASTYYLKLEELGIRNYLNANGINFIMRAKGKFKEGDDLIYTTSGERKRPEEQATVRIVAVKGRNELLVFATNTEA